MISNLNDFEKRLLMPEKQTFSGFRRGPSSDDAETARQRLKHLSQERCDDYQQWLEVGMALHSAGCSWQEWDEWSKCSQKYKHGVCEAKWDNFKADGGLTVASLIKWAKQDSPDFSPHKKNINVATESTKTKRLRNYPQTDYGSAEAFCNLFADKYRYNSDNEKWLIYDGIRWNNEQAYENASNSVVAMARMLREEALTYDLDKRGKIEKYARQLESVSKISNVLKAASTLKPILSQSKDFDNDIWLLNVNNGTIDLRTGKLLPHNSMNNLTKLAPVNFDHTAKCPRWDNFLNEIMNSDKKMVDFINRFFGMCLSGDVSEQILPLGYGVGANGKSVVCDIASVIFGDYAGEAAPGLLVNKKNESHPTEEADLAGKRLVIASETKDGESLKTELIKRLTGNAKIKARFMRQDFFEFPRTHKFLLVTNHKPIINEQTNAIWRRIRLIPFEVIIPTEGQDKNLCNKLISEASGILNCFIAGCLEWQQNGLQEPEKVLLATAAYQEEQHPLNEFIEECCSFDTFSVTPVSTLKEYYEAWALQNQHHASINARDFNTILREKGCRYDTQYNSGNTCKCWVGLHLKNDYTQHYQT